MIEFIERIQQFLAGRKTYLTSFALVVYGIAQWVEPAGTWAEPIQTGADPLQLILEGLGLGALRGGIDKYEGP